VGGPTNSVSKIRANDGRLLGTFPIGNIPGNAAFDGANIWATNLLDNTVSKLRASDGKNMGTFPTGKFPWVIAFDGSSIWIADILANAVSKLRPTDGATLGFSRPAPIRLAWPLMGKTSGWQTKGMRIP
jgi:DNA-binding beta-propeller fold protein YncE